MREMKLSGGYKTILDNEDYEKYGTIKWCISSNSNGYRYASRNITIGHKKRILILLHREILSAPKGMVVDHINHNTLDNRKINLRLCTQAENTRNRRGPNPGSASGRRGVSRHGKNWQARIRIDGREMYLGTYSNIDDASYSYWQANRKYYDGYGGNENPCCEVIDKILPAMKQCRKCSGFHGGDKCIRCDRRKR